MTHATFRRTGALLFGREWQHATGRFLEVDARTVRRWASGQNSVPPWVAERFMGEIVRRQRTLNLAERLLNR